jgi:hypothetical protein
MKEFKDKVAVITGAASGIGCALAERCVEEGTKAVLADVEVQALTKTEADMKAAGARVLAAPRHAAGGSAQSPAGQPLPTRAGALVGGAACGGGPARSRRRRSRGGLPHAASGGRGPGAHRSSPGVVAADAAARPGRLAAGATPHRSVPIRIGTCGVGCGPSGGHVRDRAVSGDRRGRRRGVSGVGWRASPRQAGVLSSLACREVQGVGKPYAGQPHGRCEGEGVETRPLVLGATP